jgi:hypothetical protein
MPPQAGCRAVAHLSDQAFQHGDAGQQHLVRDQTRHGLVEERRGPLGAGPGAGVEPAHEAQVAGLVDELLVAIPPADLGGVIPAGLPRAVAVQTGRIGDVELRGQMGDDAGRHGGRVVEERAEVAHGAELDTEAEPVVVTPPPRDERAVGVVEIKRAGQIGGRRVAIVARVGLLLCGRQEVNRQTHPSSATVGGRLGR